MSVPSYNMAVGHEASYAVSQDANTTVAVHNSTPLKFREIYIGATSLEFGWVSTGKTSSWISSETMLDPTPAHHSETLADDGQTQIINVELGSKMFPATGLIDPNFDGEIIAPAIHFDVPHGYDLWIFLFRSPWFPIKINVEKSLLNIAHNLAQATAEIESVNPNVGEQTLRVDVSVHGDGFKEVQLSIRRSMKRASLEENLGRLISGMETFGWKPTVRNFDMLLVTQSSINLGAFADFLKYLGAEIHAGTFLPSMPTYFLLCDGLNMNYSLRLIGEKHLLGHEKDETAITLKP